VLDAATVDHPLDPIADSIDVTRAEIEFAVSHEGALDVDDVLHRRTRIGLVAADAERARPAVADIVSRSGP
jgi:glycerol-3-phosphate dehydrogenase